MSSANRKRIFTVVGARPQFVKAAVISRELKMLGEDRPFDEVLIHTGQHYDEMLSDVFFKQLQIPEPGYSLNVGSHPPSVQISKITERLHEIFAADKPDAVLVYGDTNSTVAAAISAAHLNIPLIHVEAGQRIFRRHEVPEEINRSITDEIAAFCLTCTKKATAQLYREGFSQQRVRFVGDPMFDLFQWGRDQLKNFTTVKPEDYGVSTGSYHLATLHRAENTNNPARLIELLSVLDNAAKPVLLPTHPRLRKFLQEAGWRPSQSLKLIEPLGYFDFMNLLLNCERCVTDSGGVSREAFFAGKPCIMPMPSTWWPEIIEAGWIIETGSDSVALAKALDSFVPANKPPQGLFGDGRSGSKIISAISEFLSRPYSDGAWHHLGHSQDLPTRRATEFTHLSYRELIKKIKNRGDAFVSFGEAASRLHSSKLQSKTPFTVLRHDVDLDLEKAVQMAELENELGVKSTFFVLLRTEHYNVFSKKGSNAINRILELGHHLGLHFDCAAYSKSLTVSELSQACANEVALLTRWFSTSVDVVSYHRPNELVLSGSAELSAPLPHTYMPLFTKDLQYFSDSRGSWKNGSPETSEAFASGRPLHVLVHPEWWNRNPTDPFENLLEMIDAKKEILERSFAQNCTLFRVGRLKGETNETPL